MLGSVRDLCAGQLSVLLKGFGLVMLMSSEYCCAEYTWVLLRFTVMVKSGSFWSLCGCDIRSRPAVYVMVWLWSARNFCVGHARGVLRFLVFNNDKGLPGFSLLVRMEVSFDLPAAQVGSLLGTLLLRLRFSCLLLSDLVSW